MFQFMILQVICIGLLIAFPQIALWFPETLQAAARAQTIPEEHQKIIEQQRKSTSRSRTTTGERPRRSSQVCSPSAIPRDFPAVAAGDHRGGVVPPALALLPR